MNYEVSKYNIVTPENIEAFKMREVVYQPTQASTLEVENAILTLENTVEFYEAFEAMKGRLKASELITKPLEQVCTLIFKWLQTFLSDNKKIKEVNYIYTKVSLSDLIEVSILMTNEILNEE